MLCLVGMKSGRGKIWMENLKKKKKIMVFGWSDFGRENKIERIKNITN